MIRPERRFEWRRDGVGRTLWEPIERYDLPNVFSPDDLMGATLESDSLLSKIQKQASGVQSFVIYDVDHYYMGGALAELLVEQGCKVSLVTSAGMGAAAAMQATRFLEAESG